MLVLPHTACTGGSSGGDGGGDDSFFAGPLPCRHTPTFICLFDSHTTSRNAVCLCVFATFGSYCTMGYARTAAGGTVNLGRVLSLCVFFRTMSRTRWLVQVLSSNSVASARSCSRVSAHTGRTFFSTTPYTPSPGFLLSVSACLCASVSMCSVRAHCVFSPLLFLFRLVARG